MELKPLLEDAEDSASSFAGQFADAARDFRQFSPVLGGTIAVLDFLGIEIGKNRERLEEVLETAENLTKEVEDQIQQEKKRREEQEREQQFWEIQDRHYANLERIERNRLKLIREENEEWARQAEYLERIADTLASIQEQQFSGAGISFFGADALGGIEAQLASIRTRLGVGRSPI